MKSNHEITNNHERIAQSAVADNYDYIYIYIYIFFLFCIYFFLHFFNFFYGLTSTSTNFGDSVLVVFNPLAGSLVVGTILMLGTITGAKIHGMV